VGRWRPQRGFKHVDHFRGLLDSMEHCHVAWRPYEHRRDVTPFQDVCWYSGWIMVGKQKMVRHLPEWVVRQYRYVQKVPRPPTTIMPLAPSDVARGVRGWVWIRFGQTQNQTNRVLRFG